MNDIASQSPAMHFSLITPTPGYEREVAREWIRNAYEAHQWLWRFLPAQPGTEPRFLFRRRAVDGLRRFCFYLVSDREPVALAPHWQVRSKPYTPERQAGDRLAFELRANPVVSTRNASGKAARMTW
jgi:CRISPR system Cascade subunit CasE